MANNNRSALIFSTFLRSRSVFSRFRPNPAGPITRCLIKPPASQFPGWAVRQASTSLTFSVRRHAPELISPATPTPRELKLLSDIDDQAGLRYLIPMIHFYPSNPKMGNTNPASVIKDALAKVLVFDYPLAGRIKEGPGKKLMVDCTGEGVLFIEAEADVTLEQFGKTLRPPFPCVEKLVCDVPGSGGVVGSPLVQIQAPISGSRSWPSPI